MQRRRYVKLPLIFASLLACAALSACGQGSVGKRLGIERDAPDEFQVLSRPPLHIPPEFNLRPPGDIGDGGGLVTPSSQKAAEAVFGTSNVSSELNPGNADTSVMPVMSSDAASTTDQNFLNRAGASAAEPNIRRILREENGELGYEEDKTMFEKLREPNKKEPTVNAAKEAERIKENIDEGKPVSEGDVEMKEPKDRGILDKMDIF